MDSGHSESKNDIAAASSVSALFSFTNLFKTYLCCFVAKSPKKGITWAWFASLIAVLVIFIVACIATSYMEEGIVNKSVSFAAMWTVLILVAVSIGGTLIMRKFQTSIAIGFFLGVIAILSNQMLILFAIYVDQSNQTSTSDTVTIKSENAFAAFAFILFIIYTVFGVMLAVFRDDVIKNVDLTSDDDPVPPMSPRPMETLSPTV